MKTIVTYENAPWIISSLFDAGTLTRAEQSELTFILQRVDRGMRVTKEQRDRIQEIVDQQ